MSFAETYLAEVQSVAARLDAASIERAAALLARTRADGGRLFILGVGGSAADASHAVNDFRKIVNLEAYAPTDNVSELTARTNDEGWAGVFESWLRVSHLRSQDCVLVLSVGGGDIEKGVSPNLVVALKYVQTVGAKIVAIVHEARCWLSAITSIPVVSAAREHGIDLHESYLVGDRWSDVEAGQRAGCRTAWIDCGYAEPAPRVPPDVRVVSLAEAATWILNKRRKDENHDEVSTGTQSKTLR